jgi:excisionase family DNA binding protein
MRLLTVKQVSEMLQTNPAFVYELIDAGRLRAIWLRSLKVREEELERFLIEKETQQNDYHTKL